MSIDSIVVNPGRMRILASLAGTGTQEFVALRESTAMTDGNLASHAKRLQSAGFISIDKQFRDGKPVTSFTLTSRGRSALVAHVHQLMNAIGTTASAGSTDEEWVD